MDPRRSTAKYIRTIHIELHTTYWQATGDNNKSKTLEILVLAIYDTSSQQRTVGNSQSNTVKEKPRQLSQRGSGCTAAASDVV